VRSIGDKRLFIRDIRDLEPACLVEISFSSLKPPLLIESGQLAVKPRVVLLLPSLLLRGSDAVALT
jgi:hypothetical protein